MKEGQDGQITSAVHFGKADIGDLMEKFVKQHPDYKIKGVRRSAISSQEVEGLIQKGGLETLRKAGVEVSNDGAEKITIQPSQAEVNQYQKEKENHEAKKQALENVRKRNAQVIKNNQQIRESQKKEREKLIEAREKLIKDYNQKVERIRAENIRRQEEVDRENAALREQSINDFNKAKELVEEKNKKVRESNQQKMSKYNIDLDKVRQRNQEVKGSNQQKLDQYEIDSKQRREQNEKIRETNQQKMSKYEEDVVKAKEHNEKNQETMSKYNEDLKSAKEQNEKVKGSNQQKLDQYEIDSKQRREQNEKIRETNQQKMSKYEEDVVKAKEQNEKVKGSNQQKLDQYEIDSKQRREQNERIKAQNEERKAMGGGVSEEDLLAKREKDILQMMDAKQKIDERIRENGKERWDNATDDNKREEEDVKAEKKFDKDVAQKRQEIDNATKPKISYSNKNSLDIKNLDNKPGEKSTEYNYTVGTRTMQAGGPEKMMKYDSMGLTSNIDFKKNESMNSRPKTAAQSIKANVQNGVQDKNANKKANVEAPKMEKPSTPDSPDVKNTIGVSPFVDSEIEPSKEVKLDPEIQNPNKPELENEVKNPEKPELEDEVEDAQEPELEDEVEGPQKPELEDVEPEKPELEDEVEDAQEPELEDEVEGPQKPELDQEEDFKQEGPVFSEKKAKLEDIPDAPQLDDIPDEKEIVDELEAEPETGQEPRAPDGKDIRFNRGIVYDLEKRKTGRADLGSAYEYEIKYITENDETRQVGKVDMKKVVNLAQHDRDLETHEEKRSILIATDAMRLKFCNGGENKILTEKECLKIVAFHMGGGNVGMEVKEARSKILNIPPPTQKNGKKASPEDVSLNVKKMKKMAQELQEEVNGMTEMQIINCKDNVKKLNQTAVMKNWLNVKIDAQEIAAKIIENGPVNNRVLVETPSQSANSSRRSSLDAGNPKPKSPKILDLESNPKFQSAVKKISANSPDSKFAEAQATIAQSKLHAESVSTSRKSKESGGHQISIY